MRPRDRDDLGGEELVVVWIGRVVEVWSVWPSSRREISGGPASWRAEERPFDSPGRAGDPALMTNQARHPAAVVVALALLLAACQTTSVPELTDPRAIVTSAAEMAAGAKSAHVDVTIDGALEVGGGSAVSLDVNGTTASADLDITGKALMATFDSPVLVGVRGELIVKDGSAYAKTSLTGARYLLVGSDGAGVAAALDPQTLLRGLDRLLADPSISPTLGAARQCTGTDCYVVRVDLPPDVLAGLGSVTAGLPFAVDLAGATATLELAVRKSDKRPGELVLTVKGGAADLTARFTFSKWDETVTVGAPPADQIQPAP